MENNKFQSSTAIEIRRVAPGTTVLPDTKTHVHRMHVKSESSGNLYVISQTRKSGIWQCSCRGCIRWGTCKHLSTVLPILGEKVPTKRLAK